MEDNKPDFEIKGFKGCLAIIIAIVGYILVIRFVVFPKFEDSGELEMGSAYVGLIVSVVYWLIVYYIFKHNK